MSAAHMNEVLHQYHYYGKKNITQNGEKLLRFTTPAAPSDSRGNETGQDLNQPMLHWIIAFVIVLMIVTFGIGIGIRKYLRRRNDGGEGAQARFSADADNQIHRKTILV